MLVIQIEVTDGAWIVVNRNVPEKGDVGAVTGHLEVADMIDLGSCTYNDDRIGEVCTVFRLATFI